MAFWNKNKENIQSAPLADLESALKAKIEKVETIEDPIDRLLEYKALRDATVGTYDQTKADARSRRNFDGAEVGVTTLGIFGGAAGGIAGGLALATVLTGGLAAVAAVPGVAILVGTTIASNKLGWKSDQNRFNKRAKKLSPEAKHATNMLDMTRDMDETINGLTKSLSLKTMEQSPRLEELKKAFPDISDEFNRLAEIAKKKEAFLGRTPTSSAIAQAPKPTA